MSFLDDIVKTTDAMMAWGKGHQPPFWLFEYKRTTDGKWLGRSSDCPMQFTESDACAWVADSPDERRRTARHRWGAVAFASSHYTHQWENDKARCEDVRAYIDFICISVKVAANGAVTQGEPLPPIGLTPEEARP